MAEEQTTDPGSRLAVTLTSTHGIGVLATVGELDLSTTTILRHALDQAASTHPRIVVDLHELTFIDSTGMNVLIATYQSLTQAGGWLRLAAPTDTVLRTLQLIGLPTVIDCHTTLHDALTSENF